MMKNLFLEHSIRSDFTTDNITTENNVHHQDQIKENRSENVSSPKPGTIEQNVDHHDQIEQAMLGIFESPKPGIAGDVPPNNDNLESL